jgi:hypothetical protein
MADRRDSPAVSRHHTNYAILTRKTPRKRNARSHETRLQDLFERVETDSFEDIGVKVIWTDHYNEVPDRILDICNIDRRRADRD